MYNKSNYTAMLGYGFQHYVFELLKKSNNYRNTKEEVGIVGKDSVYLVDIETERRTGNKWERVLIEVKYTSMLTLDRIKLVVNRFKSINLTVSDAKFVIIFPGKLTDDAVSIVRENNIEIWDAEYLSTFFAEEISQTNNTSFQALLTNKEAIRKSQKIILIDRLKACNPGKHDWSKYQKLIGEILETLFCPPLQTPLSENSDALRANRRDYIIPNYCETGFWAFLRSRYSADYIVVDAKNYKKMVTKKEILQIANYLKFHGTGLFGVIVSRNGIGDSALFTLREVWAIEKKLIIVLQDNDIKQMLIEKFSDREPENIIRQKIEDFRLLL